MDWVKERPTFDPFRLQLAHHRIAIRTKFRLDQRGEHPVDIFSPTRLRGHRQAGYGLQTAHIMGRIAAANGHKLVDLLQLRNA